MGVQYVMVVASSIPFKKINRGSEVITPHRHTLDVVAAKYLDPEF